MRNLLASARVFVSVFGALAMVGCESKTDSRKAIKPDADQAKLDAFVKSVKENLIFVEGGEFLMGDYGIEHGPERLPYDMDKDSRPLHKVQLSSYSLGRFKITNREFDFYLASSKSVLRQDFAEDDEYKIISVPPNHPAHMDWYDAEKYCSWLASVSHLPFALPTEAQWEYAARSRGRFLMVATDDGTYKVTDDEITEYWEDGPKGVNISTSWDRKDFGKEMGWKTGIYTPLPVDRFPPNPLGLYAMSDNGMEWVRDWYDPAYYQYSPLQDPQGPEQPVYKGRDSNNQYAKVLRGASDPDPLLGGGINVQRSYRSPDGYISGMRPGSKVLVISDKTARCAVNSPSPLN